MNCVKQSNKTKAKSFLKVIFIYFFFARVLSEETSIDSTNTKQNKKKKKAAPNIAVTILRRSVLV